MAGLLLALPAILGAGWYFVAPGLRRGERRLLVALLPMALALFGLGVMFAYFTIFRYGLFLLLGLGGEILTPFISIDSYLSFALALLLPFGLVFQMPLVVFWLAKRGLLVPETLKRRRKYALLAVTAVAAVITPTVDILSQLVTALPMYLLYELSTLVATVVSRRAADR